MPINNAVIPYAIPPLISAFVVLGLGIFAYLKNPRSKTNIYFSLFMFACTTWQVGFSFMNIMKHDSDAFVFSRIIYTGVILIPVFYYGFIINFLGLPKRSTTLKLLYFSAAIFIAFLWLSRFLLSGNIHYKWGFSSRAAWLHNIFLIFFFTVFLSSFYELYKQYKDQEAQNPEKANRIKYILWSFLIALIGSTDFLSTYGVDYYPLGFIFMILFSLITLYAMAKHQLMDIRIAIEKALLYTFWTLLISIGYIAVIFLFQRILLTSNLADVTTAEWSIPISFYKWSGAVALVMHVGMAFFVYSQKRKTQTNIKFSLFSLCIGLWATGSWLVNIIPNKETALWVLRSNYAFGVFVPVLFLDFITTLTNSKKIFLIHIGYLISTLLLILDFTPYFIDGLRIIPNFDFYISKPGIIYYAFFVYSCVYFGFTLAFLIVSLRRASLDKRTQLWYIFLAYLIGTAAGIEYFSSVFGIIKRPPIDDYILIVTFSILTYAILKHGLLDIRIVIKKTLFYSLLAFSISSFYVLVIFLIHTFFLKEKFSSHYVANSVALILLITFLLRPLEMFLHRLLDRRFFKGTIAEISEQKEKLLVEIERRERLKSVGILAAGMAHEIKNPLTAIKTFNEHLPQKANNPEFVSKFNKVVSAEVEKIDNIVRQVLEFSKPAPLRLEQLDIQQIIDETLQLLEAQFIKHKVIIERHFCSPSLSINGDKTQLKQVFLNLFLNSIQAMPSGGILKISTSLIKKDRLLVTISDTGCGISKEQLPYIFDPFFTTKESGSGLGLSIVHRIVKEHGGKISVESALNNFARFQITFKYRSITNSL